MTSEAPKTPKKIKEIRKKLFENMALRALFVIAMVVFFSLTGMLVVRSKLSPKSGALDSALENATPPGKGPVELVAGAEIPDFLVRRFGQTDWLKLSQISGKVTMINFWASWCEACIVEMPSILKLRESYIGKGFILLAINLDEEPEKAIPKMVKKLGIGFPVYNDPEGKIAELFDIHAIPLTVLLDSHRKVLMIENGEVNWNSPEIHEKLEKWLGAT